MLNSFLFTPKNIAVVGASNDVTKPGGKLLKNLIDTNYQGKLRAVNPKNDQVQGIPCFRDIRMLPAVDLAVLAIPASACVEAIRILAEDKKVKAFIVISAGFSEESTEGAPFSFGDICGQLCPDRN